MTNMECTKYKDVHRRVLSFAALLLTFSLGVYSYPAPKENYVNDFAGVINPSVAQKLRDTLQLVEKQTGIEGTIVTIHSIGDYVPADMGLEEFATGLFNSWGVGNKKNKGFLVLVATKDRKCRIELGDGFGTRYNTRMKEIIDEDMVPYFKIGSYNQGIFSGTMSVTYTFTKRVSWIRYHLFHLLGFGVVLVLVIAGISCIMHGKKGWGYALFAGATGAFLLTMRSITVEKGDTSNSSGGFGGGSSSGKGGASGSW